VSSLATGVPTFVVGWSHKYREVLDMFGLADWAVASGEVTPTLFRDRLVDLDRNKTTIRKKIRAHLPKVRELALEQLNLIERVARGG
jgi:polysaccharide pyruvyl transferase WcaK-like protein